MGWFAVETSGHTRFEKDLRRSTAAFETNSQIDRKQRRVGCTFCRPHGGCNRGRQPKHGAQKPRYKTARAA